MLKKIDHIAIFVKDLDSAVKFFQETYGLLPTAYDTVGDARLAFLPIGDTQLEIIESVTPDGMVAKHIEKNGEGIHHIAFEVEDVTSELEKVKSKGIDCIDKEPRHGAHNALIAFLNPQSNYGVTIELCEHQQNE